MSYEIAEFLSLLISMGTGIFSSDCEGVDFISFTGFQLNL
jgi:hypothetical protein